MILSELPALWAPPTALEHTLVHTRNLLWLADS